MAKRLYVYRLYGSDSHSIYSYDCPAYTLEEAISTFKRESDLIWEGTIKYHDGSKLCTGRRYTGGMYLGLFVPVMEKKELTENVFD